jgi:CheY-like chemotaxis protein
MKSRILAIDDDAIVRRLLVRLLTNQGYEVRTAADGEAGLIALEEEAGPAGAISVVCAGPNRVFDTTDANALMGEATGDDVVRVITRRAR